MAQADEVLAFGVQTRDERAILESAFAGRYPLRCLDVVLNEDTAPLADGYEVVSASVNADLSAPVLRRLDTGGTKAVCQRSTGFNNIDLDEAERLGLYIARVDYYSPYSVAEFAWTLALGLDRNLPRATIRTRDFDFRLDGLLGRDVHGRTIGVIGTGKIGESFARIAAGFGVTLLGWDARPNPACEALGLTYVPLPDLLAASDVISLHVPLLPETHHLIDAPALSTMKPDALLINTSRGGLINSEALVKALKEHRLGGVALDVYEEEAGVFFYDRSHEVVADDVLARLMTFPNVLVTSHQAYFTRDAVEQIVNTTLANVDAYYAGRRTAATLVPRG
ncbi:2-hydroxyacid dehydrogenase [Catenulispora yoronensis]|uniref:2-hydroxyacid dehydrogenase n=1 Tax=Catenulispora yoronensis TaxID=450799 RepID=A0ABP5GP80_9ACTN